MDKKVAAAYSNLMKSIKIKCAEHNITLIFDKLENEGGSCKYKDKTYIFLNKIHDDAAKLLFFFNEIDSAGYSDIFADLKESFAHINASAK